MTRVFISHNYKDKPLARKISNTLNYYGIQTWIDEGEIKVGDSLITKIRAGIDNTDYLVALISQHSVESEWVLKELDIAMNKEIEGKRVVVLPILAGKCNLPGFLKGKLYLDMSTPKSFSKSVPQLLLRFDIENVFPENELHFTSEDLSLVDFMGKLLSNSGKKNCELWKSISYDDKRLFVLDEFRKFLLEYIARADLDSEELKALIKAYDRCAEKDNLLEDAYLELIKTDNITLLNVVITSIIRHRISSTVMSDAIYEKLKVAEDTRIIYMCLQYFGEIYCEFDFEINEQLLQLCDNLLCNYTETRILNSLIKTLLHQFGNDKGIGRVVKLWKGSDDNIRREIISVFASLGADNKLTFFNIESPKLRDQFKEMILASFSEENDLLNANIVCALFITDDLFDVFPRNEVWDIVGKLDDYSVLALLEKLSVKYNVEYLFDSNKDISELEKMLQRKDMRIHEQVFSILADIQSKLAIDILIEHQYQPQYYNVDNVIMTLVKESEICTNKDYYFMCRKVRLENSDQIDAALLALCDYLIDNNTISRLISSLQIDLSNFEMGIRNRKKMLRFICDILSREIDVMNESDSQFVKQFIKDCKNYNF